MLTLYKFTPALGLPDLSPFVVKLETYLRMAGIEYEAKPGDPRRAPKKKLPYVEHDGKTLGDTRFVIEHLKATLGDPLDGRLGARDRAIAQAYRSMLEEHLYFVIVYQRWVEDPGWAVYEPVMRDVLAKGGIPSLVRGFVLGQVRKQMVGSCYQQGTGRHSAPEVDAIGRDIVTSVSQWLGDNPYFFGAEPTSIDATAYAFLWGLLDMPFPSKLRDEASKVPNLRAYVDRIKARYWA